MILKVKIISKILRIGQIKNLQFSFGNLTIFAKKNIENAKMKEIRTYVFSKIAYEKTHVIRNAKSNAF